MAHSNISAKQALDWLTSGDAILIDVREADEFSAEHIAYAASMPLGAVADVLAGLELPKSRKIIFQCLKGMRGQKACSLVGDDMLAGYDIYNIEGGINAWKDADLPVVSSSSSASVSNDEIFRQVQIIIGLFILVCVFIGQRGFPEAFTAAGVIGALLALAGVTGTCMLGIILRKMPWNK